LLGQTTVLSRQELILVMAWKMGEIDHRRSDATQNIVYWRGWDTTLRDRYHRDFSGSINYLAANMTTIQAQANQGNLQHLFDLFPRLKHSKIKFFDSVHFVVVDLDVQRSPEQQELVKKYYKGYIPHVVVLDAHGEPLYNQSGEVDSAVIEDLFKRAAGQ
jgi:hypothetical protein